MASITGDLLHLFLEARLTEGRSKRIARDAGVDFSSVSWSSDEESFWDTVLWRAHTTRSMDRLFTAADSSFGDNHDWQAAKEGYWTALMLSSQSPSSTDPQDATVASGLYERHLEALRDALSLIQPFIFERRDIQASRLDAALQALLVINPLIEMLHAAAGNADANPLRRHELQKVAERLEESCDAVYRKLVALRAVRSEGVSSELCDDLAKGSAILFAQYRQAIDYGT